MSISFRRYGAILASSSTLVCYGKISSPERENTISLKTATEPKENGAVRTASTYSHVAQRHPTYPADLNFL